MKKGILRKKKESAWRKTMIKHLSIVREFEKENERTENDPQSIAPNKFEKSRYHFIRWKLCDELINDIQNNLLYFDLEDVEKDKLAI